MPTMKSTGGKGCMKDCVTENGDFVMFDVVGIVGVKDG